MKRALAGLLLLLFIGCGGEPGLQIAFTAHPQVTCGADGLEAHLEATGVDGVCPLIVNADRTVTGTCHDVPTGEPRSFRLVYFASYDRPYELAVAIEQRDLTNVDRDTLILEFPADSLMIDQDDDGDTLTNLEEFCCGSHPGIRDSTCP